MITPMPEALYDIELFNLFYSYKSAGHTYVQPANLFFIYFF